jgi:hypothetical protein
MCFDEERAVDAPLPMPCEVDGRTITCCWEGGDEEVDGRAVREPLGVPSMIARVDFDGDTVAGAITDAGVAGAAGTPRAETGGGGEEDFSSCCGRAGAVEGTVFCEEMPLAACGVCIGDERLAEADEEGGDANESAVVSGARCGEES